MKTISVNGETYFKATLGWKEPESMHLRLFFNVYLGKDSVFGGDFQYDLTCGQFVPPEDESPLLRAILEKVYKRYRGRRIIEKIRVTPFCLEILTDEKRCKAANITNHQIRQTVKAAIKHLQPDYVVAAVPL